MSIRALFLVIQRVERALLGTAILAIAALTCTNVVTRTAFGISLAAAEELTRMLMLVVTFVGLSYAASQGRHIRMSALYDQLPERWRKGVMVSNAATTSLLLAALTVWSVQYIDTMRVLGTASSALQLPLYLVYLVAPLGLALAATQYALVVVRNLMSDGVWVAFDVRDQHDDVPTNQAV